MTENLVNSFMEMLSGLSSLPFGKELTIFIISLFPILELRGGLIAASLLKLPPIKSFIICFIGNIVPIPFILTCITPIFAWMKKTRLFRPIAEFFEKKAENKKGSIVKAEFIGLLLFVGIPLPGTGAWTGCLIASMIGMNKKKAVLAALLGVIMAGCIMLVFSYGILGQIIG